MKGENINGTGVDDSRWSAAWIEVQGFELDSDELSISWEVASQVCYWKDV